MILEAYSRILSPTSALCLPSFRACAAPCVSCRTAPAAASALCSAALAAVKSCHPHIVCLFSAECQSEITMAMRTGEGHHVYQSAKGVSDSVFYLFLMNLYFLLQVFNIALVVLNDCILLCQFIALFVNSIFFGSEVTIHLLEHGHQCVSLKKVTDARRCQQLSKPTVRESWDATRHLLYCTAEAPSV